MEKSYTNYQRQHRGSAWHTGVRGPCRYHVQTCHAADLSLIQHWLNTDWRRSWAKTQLRLFVFPRSFITRGNRGNYKRFTPQEMLSDIQPNRSTVIYRGEKPEPIQLKLQENLWIPKAQDVREQDRLFLFPHSVGWITSAITSQSISENGAVCDPNNTRKEYVTTQPEENLK